MTTTNLLYDMVIIGNYTKDTIVTPRGTGHVDGGGFNYGVHVAIMMGLRVAAVTRLAKEDKHVVDYLIKLGADVFPFYSAKSTHMRLFYPTDDVDNRVLSVTSLADPFQPEQFETLSARAFLINASTRGEVDLDVVETLKRKDTIIVADAQGFVRTVDGNGILKYDSWPGKENIMSKLDVLKCDSVEAETLTKEKNIKNAALCLAEWGPKEIVLTHKGGIMVFAEGHFYEAPFLPKTLVGRSGRGDTCISAYMAKRLNGSPRQATIWAAAVTSLKMETEGPILRTEQEVYNMINKKYTTDTV
jgi:sugar/nucleoside kinase (ribokinase family)